jgi:hypothetical protein
MSKDTVPKTNVNVGKGIATTSASVNGPSGGNNLKSTNVALANGVPVPGHHSASPPATIISEDSTKCWTSPLRSVTNGLVSSSPATVLARKEASVPGPTRLAPSSRASSAESSSTGLVGTYPSSTQSYATYQQIHLGASSFRGQPSNAFASASQVGHAAIVASGGDASGASALTAAIHNGYSSSNGAGEDISCLPALGGMHGREVQKNPVHAGGPRPSADRRTDVLPVAAAGSAASTSIGTASFVQTQARFLTSRSGTIGATNNQGSNPQIWHPGIAQGPPSGFQQQQPALFRPAARRSSSQGYLHGPALSATTFASALSYDMSSRGVTGTAAVTGASSSSAMQGAYNVRGYRGAQAQNSSAYTRGYYPAADLASDGASSTGSGGTRAPRRDLP